MADIPIESPFKYGRLEADEDEFITLLNGGTPNSTNRTKSVSQPSNTDTVDEDFLRQIGSPRNHYGE